MIRTVLNFLIFLAALCPRSEAAAVKPPSTLPIYTPTPSLMIVDSLGVNTRIGTGHSAYEHFDTFVKPRLLELGVLHIRDFASTQNAQAFAHFTALKRAGINVLLQVEAADAVDVVKALPGAVYSIELVSDRDRDAKSLEKLIADQKILFDSIKHYAPAKDLTVVSPTLANPNVSLLKMGALSTYCDTIGFRCQAFGGSGNATLLKRVAAQRTAVLAMLGSKPLWVNEFPLETVAGETPAAEARQALLLPKILLKMATTGASLLMVSEFMDVDAQHPRGLLRADGTPRPIFFALKRFIAFFKEKTFARVEPLPMKVEAAPKDLGIVFIARTDGSYYLLLWLNAADSGETDVPPRTLTIEFGAPLQSISAFYPFRESDPERNLPDTHKVNVLVGPEILCLKLVRPK